MGINKKLLILGSFIFLILIVSASVISPEAIKKELEVIHFDVVEKQASLDLVNKKLKNTPKEIVSTKLIRPKQVDAQMMAMLNDLKAQMAEKLTIYREKHPVIKSLQSRIDYLQRLIDSQKTKKDMERKISLNPEFSDLTQKKNQLETQIKGLLARKMELQKVLKKIDIENEKKNDIKENDKEKNTKK
ncbi:MAG: hypothetical protein C0601_02460 [Candidatus Muiribacterium halophilum]|uniref:Uncharacterized protein n=1 Tax=Muiribacterium halophilum TaxID=2053465 RepID=A0A2N5ZKQ6_MUIH1|nr:MAG: hypothetical protein C0601_02460 [Candidatus Muirbacterium halophilum]